MRIDIHFDPRELKKMEKALKSAPGECRKGMVSAINRSAKSVNTATQKAVTERYKIKKSDLSGGKRFKGESSNNIIKPIFASESDLRAALDVRGSRLAYVAERGMMSPRAPKSHKGKTMKQIKRLAFPTVQPIRGQRTRFPHGFIIEGKEGVVGLFTRGKKSHPVEMRHTLSPANMVRYPDIVRVTQKTAREALEKNVAHEIEYRLGRLAK